MVSQVSPMVSHCFLRGKKDEVNAKLWWLICAETKILVPRDEFSLQVTARNTVKFGFHEMSHYDDWQRDVMPKLIIRGVKFIDDRTDQEIGECGGPCVGHGHVNDVLRCSEVGGRDRHHV